MNCGAKQNNNIQTPIIDTKSFIGNNESMNNSWSNTQQNNFHGNNSSMNSNWNNTQQNNFYGNNLSMNSNGISQNNTNQQSNYNQFNDNSNKTTPSKEVNSNKGSSFNFGKLGFALAAIVLVFIGIFVTFAYMNRENSRTVMIYMVGSNLEENSGLATRDLSDLDYRILASNKVKVILMAGGTKQWKNDYIDTNQTSIYELNETGFAIVDSREVQNMGASENLSYFLNYAYDHYSSDKYDLIFWNHGGAIDGSEYDDIFQDNLKPTEMYLALEASPFKEKNKLEVVSFRTCLNATIEIANVFQDYANYLVASEEVTIGARVDSALRFLNDITAKDKPVDYGIKEIENYKEMVQNICTFTTGMVSEDYYCVNSTYSLIDLSKVKKINEDFEKFATDLSTQLPSKYDEFSKIRANLSQYAVDDADDGSGRIYDMVDLYDFVSKYRDYSTISKDLMSSIESAIVYNFTNNDYSHGLSVYYPYNGAAFLSTYDKVTSSVSYQKYVFNFYQLKNERKTTSRTDFSKLTPTITETKKNETDFEITLTEEQANNYATAQYIIFVDNKNGYHQILYSGRDAVLEGNTLKATVQGKMLRVSDIEYEDENHWITLIQKEVGEDYLEVTTVPILKRGTFGGDVVTMTIRIDKEHPNGYITAITSTDKNTNNTNKLAVFSKEGVQLKDYSFIEFVTQEYKILTPDGQFDKNFLQNGNGIYEGVEFPVEEFKFIKEDFDSEYDYYAVFRIWDTAGNEYYSNLVKMK
mgnify:CR=1 FL=1